MTTTTDTPATTRQNTMLAGHRTLGRLLLRLGADVDICVWRVAVEHARAGAIVGGQLAVGGDDDQRRRDIRRAAELVGLAYSESPRVRSSGYAYTVVSAVGVFDGADVEIWAHVDRTEHDKAVTT